MLLLGLEPVAVVVIAAVADFVAAGSAVVDFVAVGFAVVVVIG